MKPNKNKSIPQIINDAKIIFDFGGYVIRDLDETTLWLEFPSGEGMEYPKLGLVADFLGPAWEKM